MKVLHLARRRLLGCSTVLALAAVHSVDVASAAAQPAPAPPGRSSAAEATRMLRQPAVSRDHLAFVYAGDLWLADRNGASPRRLSSHAASEFAPRFSPDGRSIAYSASYGGNTDVYLIGIDGGTPKRLTWHPSEDIVCGFSPDGRRVLFASPREVLNHRSRQLFEVSVDGGYEKKLMAAPAYEGAWSPDGGQLAYRPYGAAYSGASGWRQSRGGTTPPVWIMQMQGAGAGQQWQAVPHVNASDIAPVWAQSPRGREVVFISDRADGAANLFAFNPATQALRQLTRETVWDVRSVDAHGSTLVYETGGVIKELDLAAGAAPRVLDIRLAGLAPQPQWKDAGKALTQVRLSTTGLRVLASARGEVFTVPVKDGSVRNLTATPGVREKDALWSPDGQRVAYVSDAPGMRHQLVLQAQTGLGAPEVLPLPAAGYFTLLDWSPDGAQLVLADNHLNLYRMAVGAAAGAQRGQMVKIATHPRRGPNAVAFSPDSRWLAYVSVGENFLARLWLHELATGRNHAVSDGLAHAGSPAFSPKGEVLYFTASINAGPAAVGLDLSSQERPRRAGLFGVLLAADGKSPLAPKAGDEEVKKDEPKDDAKDPRRESGKDGRKDDKQPAAAPKPEPVKPLRVDLEGLAERVIALPLAERNHDRLAVGADGALFYLQRPQPGASNEPPLADRRATAELWRYDFTERKPKLLKTGVADYTLSADRKKLLLTLADNKLEQGDASDKYEGKPVDLSGLRALIDPAAEWKQIFDEVWWMEREFFYDPALHGLDWQAVYDRYRPLLAHVQRREDLTDLIVQMIGELQVGHNRAGGGDVHVEGPAAVGLLGADFAVEQGRYKITRLYPGDRLNPHERSPLATPGLGVREGDFVLAVGGRELDARTSLYALLENTVGKQVTLTVARDAAGQGRREITVEPVASERALRRWAWIEGNRQKVEKASGGRIAYVYMPDTGSGGYEHFNRMFFAQVDKPALIVDDRANGGGQAANYVTELLSRPYLASWKDRAGLVFDTPGGAIYGPKAMLVDQDAGSGGDFMPYAFKRVGLGPLIGKRTWGGLIGISANPPLVDGGFLTVPYFRFYTPEGEWRIENEGVAPDIDVELDPAAVNRGEDTQLDAAIADVLRRLADWKPVQRRPPPPAPPLGR